MRKWLFILTLIAVFGGGAGFFVSYFGEENVFRSLVWRKAAELQAPDGYTYYYMDYAVIQGQTLLLARAPTGSRPANSYVELGSTNGDSPRSWIPVVRPKGASDTHQGQLCISPEGLIVGIRCSNECYFAYDTRSGRFYGHGAVEGISPFVLLEKDTELHDPDVLALLRTAAPGHDCSADLDHPNSRVRQIAQWRLALAGETTPDSVVLQEALDYVIAGMTSANRQSRINACEAILSFSTPYRSKAIPVLEGVVAAAEQQVASNAAHALGTMGEQAFPAMLRLLTTRDPAVRHHALYAFRTARRQAYDCAKSIIPLLADPDSCVRAQAVLALDAMEYYEEDVIPYLEDLRTDSDPLTAKCARIMLNHMSR